MCEKSVQSDSCTGHKAAECCKCATVKTRARKRTTCPLLNQLLQCHAVRCLHLFCQDKKLHLFLCRWAWSARISWALGSCGPSTEKRTIPAKHCMRHWNHHSSHKSMYVIVYSHFWTHIDCGFLNTLSGRSLLCACLAGGRLPCLSVFANRITNSLCSFRQESSGLKREVYRGKYRNTHARTDKEGKSVDWLMLDKPCLRKTSESSEPTFFISSRETPVAWILLLKPSHPLWFEWPEDRVGGQTNKIPKVPFVFDDRVFHVGLSTKQL